MPAPHNILMLAFPNGQLLDIAGPLQMFAGANDELVAPSYRIEIAAPQSRALRDLVGRSTCRRPGVRADHEQAAGAHPHAASRSAASPACGKSSRAAP